MSLQKAGKKSRRWTGVLEGRRAYAVTVAELLLKEHGSEKHTVKKLMRQTHASQRTVKHWLAGEHGPDALFFLRLMVSSPVIRAFFLGVIESASAEGPEGLVDRSTLSQIRNAYARGEHAVPAAPSGDDPLDGPNRDTMNDPDSKELNQRQLWFLTQLSSGSRCCAEDLIKVWSVSLKTARRDIALLKSLELVTYVGSRRNGRYRPARLS